MSPEDFHNSNEIPQQNLEKFFFQTLCSEVFYEGHYKEHNFFKVKWYY